MRSRPVCSLHLAAAMLLLLAAESASTVQIVINNGLAPPNPANVINEQMASGQ